MPPINDALCLYRALSGASVANEGQRPEPLLMGSTPPVFTADPALGDHWLYSAGQWATAAPPIALLNGDVTFALRYRTTGLWADRLLLSMIDNPGPQGLKHFMLHQSSGNKYYARFWGDILTRPQIAAISTTSVSLSRTDTVVVTWESATRTLVLYVNGAQEALTVSADPRTQAASAVLGVPYQGVTSLTPAGRLFRLAFWGRALSAAEALALQAEPWWTSDGPPPPPPPPPALVVRFNGSAVPWSVSLNGNAVGGPGDTIDITG